MLLKIHRLPTELLCAIFLMCGEPNDIFNYPRAEHMQSRRDYRNCKTPLYSRMIILLGHVCSRWFTVTRGCPQLWTMIDVPLPSARDTAALKLALQYSAGLPLTLRMDDNHYTDPLRRKAAACRRFMQLVASTSSRWEEISLIVKYEPPKIIDMIQPLLDLPRYAFVRLQRATIRFETDDRDGSATSRLWESFYASPVLRTVQWFFAVIHAPSSTLRQLTRIGVNAIRSDKVMALLQACPQLEVLQAVVRHTPGVMPGKNDGYLIPSIATPIILRHLRVLMLSGMYDWSNLFGGLVVPNLVRLDLAVAGIQSDAIRAMLRRSSAHPRMLALRWILPGNDDELKLLFRCHELQDLRILRYDPYDGPRIRYRNQFDPLPYIPPHIVFFTQSYAEAEQAYHALVVA